MALMKDVAKRAGVSLTTVSFVLNGAAKEHKVADATINRVLSAARELGYYVNAPSSADASPRQRTIAVFFAMESIWTDLGAMAESIYQHMKARGVSYNILIVSYDVGALTQALAQADWNTIDAAVVIAGHEADLRRLAAIGARYPLVLFGRTVEGYDSVLCSAEQSIERTVAMVQAKGYESIAVILGSGKAKIGDEHFMQLLSACQARGITLEDRHTVRADNTLQGGAVAARQLLNSGKVPPMILCMNTTLAFGAIPFLARNRVYIPGSSEFLCFGWDSELDYMKNYIPALSIIAYPMEEMTRHALDLAMQAAHGYEREPAQYRCESMLALNESFTV